MQDRLQKKQISQASAEKINRKITSNMHCEKAFKLLLPNKEVERFSCLPFKFFSPPVG
jgi:hypothetical protein